VFRRILAFFIDHITVCIGIGIVSSIHIILADKSSIDELQSFVFGYSSVMWYAYIVLRDSFFGRSIGKKMMGLHIKQSTNNQTQSKGNLIKRNLTLLLLPVEVIVFFFHRQNRRLGDLWTGSIVRTTDANGEQ
jgi:uncharacterized RDD family membrane protein YckC